MTAEESVTSRHGSAAMKIALRACVLLVGLPVLYFLSIGPIYALGFYNHIPPKLYAYFTDTFYAPLHRVEFLSEPTLRYCELCATLLQPVLDEPIRYHHDN